MRLKPAQDAPDFEATDISGRRVSLADYRGRRLLLSFYRAAVCPLCNVRTWHLIDRAGFYHQRGVDIVVFFESPAAMTHRYVDRMHPSFPVVPDPERRVYMQYGLESSLWGAVRARLTRWGTYREAARKHIGGGLIRNVLEMGSALPSMPGDFLIGPDGRIDVAYYGRDAGDFLLFRELDHYLGMQPLTRR